jgi:hypothetical protein
MLKSTPRGGAAMSYGHTRTGTILKLQVLHFNYVFAVVAKERPTPVLHLKHLMTEEQ